MRKRILPINKSDSWKMFDHISPRYDLLNRILSLGLDMSWRRKMADYLPVRPQLLVLDLATGTADVLISLLKKARNLQGIGIDLAKGMLSIGRKKVYKNGLDGRIYLRHGDANQIPFSDNNFDVVTMAFGIRNVADPMLGLNEMLRVLKKGGRAIILEFSFPDNPILKKLQILYLRIFIPLIGGILSGNFKAYYYLSQTIQEFPYAEEFTQLMRNAGFKDVKANPLFLGIATIYHGDKEE